MFNYINDCQTFEIGPVRRIYTVYSVAVRTSPWTEKMEVNFGFFATERVALKAIKILQDKHMWKIPGGIYLKLQRRFVRLGYLGDDLYASGLYTSGVVYKKVDKNLRQELENYRFTYGPF